MTDTSQPSANNKLKLIMLVIVALGLVALLLLPQFLQPKPQGNRLLIADPNCKLEQQQCSAKEDSSSVSLAINAEQIRSMTPLRFEVELNNVRANQVMLDIKGRDMYMGINQVQMSRVPGTENRWQGDVTLAVCSTGEMTWITSVISESDGNVTQANFEFKAK